MLAGRWTRPRYCKAPSLCGRFVHWCVCEIAYYIPPQVWPVLWCVSQWAVDVCICQWDHGAAVCVEILTGPSDVKSFSVALSGKKNLHTSRNPSVQLFSSSANSLKHCDHCIQLFFFQIATRDLLSEGVNISATSAKVLQKKGSQQGVELMNHGGNSLRVLITHEQLMTGSPSARRHSHKYHSSLKWTLVWQGRELWYYKPHYALPTQSADPEVQCNKRLWVMWLISPLFHKGLLSPKDVG